MASRAVPFALLVLLLAGAAQAQAPRFAKPSDRTIIVGPQFGETAGFLGQQENPLGSSVVSTVELSVPASARKQLEKANELLRKQDATQALKRLEKALAICPKFADAYNSMAVAFARLGDTASERRALQTALQLDERFALAYINWARLDIAGSDFDDADRALRKAFSLDQSDPTALMLLSYVAWRQGRMEDALLNVEQAHAMGKPHAFAHRVAARVYESQQRIDRAIAELELSLKEEPKGSLADGGRHELALVRALPR